MVIIFYQNAADSHHNWFQIPIDSHHSKPDPPSQVNANVKITPVVCSATVAPRVSMATQWPQLGQTRLVSLVHVPWGPNVNKRSGPTAQSKLSAKTVRTIEPVSCPGRFSSVRSTLASENHL